MPEENKNFLKGWRKIIAGIIAMITGIYLMTQGHVAEGVTVFLAGLAAVCGGTVVDKILNKK